MISVLFFWAGMCYNRKTSWKFFYQSFGISREFHEQEINNHSKLNGACERLRPDGGGCGLSCGSKKKGEQQEIYGKEM